MEGSPAHFEAKLVPIGDSKLRVNWLKNGKPIQCSNRMSTLNDFGFVALDLKYTRTDDSGAYTCNAINELGEANITANLKVWTRVSVQGVKSFGGHFACLCRGFEFYKVKKKMLLFFKKKMEILLHF